MRGFPRDSHCGGIGMNYQTQNNKHEQAKLHVYATLFQRVRTMSAAGRLLAAPPKRITH